MVNPKILFIPVEYIGMTIGVLTAIMSICFIGGYIYVMENFDGYSKDLHREGADLADIKWNIAVLLSAGLVVNACMFVASIVLVLAVIKMSPKLVLPWLINIVCYFIFFVISISLLASTRKDILTEFKSFGAVVGLSITACFIIIAAVLIVLVYRHFRYKKFILGMIQMGTSRTVIGDSNKN